MKIVTAGDVTLDRAWAAVDLARIADATVRLHWTDEPMSGTPTTASRSSLFSTEQSTCTTVTGPGPT